MTRFLILLLTVAPPLGLAAEQSPYAGEERRAIKSLSETEIASLRRGDGMGYAKLAELNHFPGPKHVLELAEELGLGAAQLEATRALYEDMRQQAVALGEELLDAESRLDQAFAAQAISPVSLEAALLEIGELRARLRYAHLEAHLRQKALLTPAQVESYDRLRGYGNGRHRHGVGHKAR